MSVLFVESSRGLSVRPVQEQRRYISVSATQFQWSWFDIGITWRDLGQWRRNSFSSR